MPTNEPSDATTFMDRAALTNEIYALRRELRSLIQERDSWADKCFALMSEKTTEWQVIYRAGKHEPWYLSGRMYPGISKAEALRLLDMEKQRGAEAKIQVRKYSDWVDATGAIENAKEKTNGKE